MNKKIFTAINLTVLFLMFLSIKIYAFSGSGSGTIEDPYLVSNVGNLIEINDDLGASYELINNIEIQKGTFIGIAGNGKRFSGVFNGRGFTISGLGINRSTSFHGLFSSTSNAIIKKLNIRSTYDIEVSTSIDIYCDRVGILVGKMSGGKIEDCSVSSYSSLTAEGYVGGLVGYMDERGTINNCWSAINVKSTGSRYKNSRSSYVGGLIGYAEQGSTITNCYATGSVTAYKSFAGGLIGYAGKVSTINNCYATGNVTYCGAVEEWMKPGHVGGLIGASQSDISKCYATGNVIGDYRIGGLVGGISGSINDCFATGTVSARKGYSGGLAGEMDRVKYLEGYESVYDTNVIKNSFATGAIKSAVPSYGLTGNFYNLITNSYFDKNTTGITTPTAQARTSSQLRTKANFVGWDFNSVWVIDDGAHYPYLKGFANPHKMLSGTYVSLASKNDNSISVTWPAIRSAVKYEVSVNDRILTTSGTSIVIDNLDSNTKYLIKVKGESLTISSPWSGILTVTTDKKLMPPKGLDYSVEGEKSVCLSWDAEEGATSYSVSYYDKIIKSTENNILLDLLPNVEYQIKIRSENSYSISDWSDYINVKLSQDSRISIKTVADFDKMRNNLSGDFVLENDIDLNNIEWRPIGSPVPFTGSFDGNGYTIKNLKMNSSRDAGFFGYINGSIIKNIVFENVNISGQDNTGTLASCMSGGTVEACFVKGNGAVEGRAIVGYTGGLIGKTSDNTKIMNSGISIDVKDNGYYSNIGGILGMNGGQVLGCYSTGNIFSGGNYANVGGIVGTSAINTIIKDCFASGDIEGRYRNIAGIVGDPSCRVVNCYFVGTVKAMSPHGIGGIGMTIIENSYFDSQKTGINSPTEQARTTALLKTKSTFVNWDFNNIWSIDEGKSYPYLKHSKDTGEPAEPGFPTLPAEKQEINLSAVEDQEYILAFTADIITKDNTKIFTIEYNPAHLEILDFAAQTPKADLSVGMIEGTNIEIVSHANGIIKIKLHMDIDSNKAYSGVLTSIKFKAKSTISTKIKLEQ